MWKYVQLYRSFISNQAVGVQRFYGGGLRVLCKAIITEAKSTNECQNIQNIYSHFLQEIQDFFYLYSG